MRNGDSKAMKTIRLPLDGKEEVNLIRTDYRRRREHILLLNSAGLAAVVECDYWREILLGVRSWYKTELRFVTGCRSSQLAGC